MATLNFFRSFYFILVIIFFVSDAQAWSEKEGKIDYDIIVNLDPDTRRIEGKSTISIQRAGEFELRLDRRFEVAHILLNGVVWDSQNHSKMLHVWHIPFGFSQLRRIEIFWHGYLSELDTTLDHRQILSRAEPVSGEQGTFLPKSASWYPHIAGVLASYRLKLTLPPGQRGLVAGQLLEESETQQGYQASFDFPFPSEGIDLMAGPYEITSDVFQGVTGKSIQLRTYFHTQIRHLSPDYLDAVKDYLALYESWIGTYPFTEFSVVSSPTPTGFGMPTLTYLGVSVLQLPFIRKTSLGHEVLHNWWGNGVYPDYQSGNWSEGLTTFMADYAYKERESNEAAREMRLGWLRDFSSMGPDQDFPLVSFTSRTHGVSKIVGYNKSAMFFFMLRDYLGEEVFTRAVQALWKTQRFRVASWQHLQKIFELVSGRNLQFFFDQWLERPGAPEIHIEKASSIKTDAGYQLTVLLRQSRPVYQLSVPVAIRSQEREDIRILNLQDQSQTFHIQTQARPLEVILDPDLQLLRRLDREEAPPVIREAMVNQLTETVFLPGNEKVLNVAKTLASKFQHYPLKLSTSTDHLSEFPLLVIGLHHQVDFWLKKNKLSARPSHLAGQGSAQVWTLARPNGSTVVIISALNVAALEDLIRPLPHYGRQSFVIFEGRKMVDQGIWPILQKTVSVE